VLEGNEQERSEPPALALEIAQVVLLEHSREEPLRQILRFFWRVSETADRCAPREST
jgi:hypothetical protein